MWTLDFPEHDPDENYPQPSAKQLLDAEQARHDLSRLAPLLRYQRP